MHGATILKQVMTQYTIGGEPRQWRLEQVVAPNRNLVIKPDDDEFKSILLGA